MSNKTLEQKNQIAIDILVNFYAGDDAYRLACAMKEWQEKIDFNKYQVCNGCDVGVFAWNSGRDCDGVTYGNVTFIKAKNYKEYVAALDSEYAWADGPMSYSILPNYEVIEASGNAYSVDTFAEAAGY